MGNIKKHKNNRKKKKKTKNDNKIENTLQASEPIDTVKTECSPAITTKITYEKTVSHIEEQLQEKKHANNNISKRNPEQDESNTEEQPKKKKKKKYADINSTRITNEDDEPNIEELPKKEKKHVDNSTSEKEHEDVESDIEEQPKKKKKKKHAVTEETTNKKGKKSNRQLKKERFLQRQAEAELAAKHLLKSECLNYLSQWKYNKQNWKFMKAKQGWLFKNKFSTELVPDEIWPILLEYFQTGQGNIRKILKDDASKVIKQMDEWTESQENKNIENEDDNATENMEIIKPDSSTYKRARDIIQCLE